MAKDRDQLCTTLNPILLDKLRLIAAAEHHGINDIIERVMTPYVDSYDYFSIPENKDSKKMR
jgi:hypothetical protein